jgi:magnesium transporter
MRQHRLLALPVVDGDGRLLGVVRHDEILDAVQEEAFEDLQKLVGAGGDETVHSPLGTATRRRLPWLCANLLTAFAGAAVISLFEPLLARVTALAILLPIVSALGGNGGAQTLAVVMRGLALREIGPGAGRRLLLKEMLAGLLNGLAVGAVAAGAVFAWTRSGGLALVIGLAMVVNMVTAGLAGAAIPLALRALGRDPAQSSQIFLTTLTDMVGFAAFLGFAALFFPLLG